MYYYANNRYKLPENGLLKMVMSERKKAIIDVLFG
jgi:hypothetical protein